MIPSHALLDTKPTVSNYWRIFIQHLYWSTTVQHVA